MKKDWHYFAQKYSYPIILNEFGYNLGSIFKATNLAPSQKKSLKSSNHSDKKTQYSFLQCSLFVSADVNL